MKGLKKILLAVATLPFMASCLDSPDSFSQSGFTNISCDFGFANTTKGYAGLYSLGGKWQISQNSGGDWCKLDRMSGSAQMFYQIGITFEPNTTDTLRAVRYVARDMEDDGMASFIVYQFATRGDGSLGSSPLVKSIKGTDGSEITIAYDDMARPTALMIEKNSNKLHDIKLSYHSGDSTIAINNGRGYLTSKYHIGYMPKGDMTSNRDTLTASFKDIYGNSVYYLMEKQAMGKTTAMSILYNEPSGKFAYPYYDSEHKADSIKYVVLDGAGKTTFSESLGLKYSDNSNRRQSVDVNQLLLGVEHCSPYALLSIYRTTRISRIISEANTASGNYNVTTTLNEDKSVATMTVASYKQTEPITYTFEYYQ